MPRCEGMFSHHWHTVTLTAERAHDLESTVERIKTPWAEEEKKSSSERRRKKRRKGKAKCTCGVSSREPQKSRESCASKVIYQLVCTTREEKNAH